MLAVTACTCMMAVLSVTCGLAVTAYLKPTEGTTLDEVQQQVSRQFREQWGGSNFQSVEVPRFEPSGAEDELVIGLRIHWDKRRGISTAMRLHRTAGRYYSGTFSLEGIAMPDGLTGLANSLRPVHVQLTFKE